MDYKGNNNKDNDEDDEITNIFNSLVVNIDPSTPLDEDDQTTVYYTSYGEIKPDNATAIALELANRAYSHVITTINTIIDAFPTNIDPFVYNTTLYYTSIKFIGIIINTRASKRSIRQEKIYQHFCSIWQHLAAKCAFCGQMRILRIVTCSVWYRLSCGTLPHLTT